MVQVYRSVGWTYKNVYVYSRSSHWRCSIKKGVLKIFAIFTEKDLCWNLFIKLLINSLFIKKRLQHRCFLKNIARFLRTPILKNICEWLLLMFLWTEYFKRDYVNICDRNTGVEIIVEIITDMTVQILPFVYPEWSVITEMTGHFFLEQLEKISLETPRKC